MTDTTIPCIKHGVSGTSDDRLRKTLEISSREASELRKELSSLVDFQGQLWATWHDEAARDRHSGILTKAWAETSGQADVMHLVPTDENFDYQEDCMNDPN